MPVLAFLAFVGIALVALLFVADATLERDSPVIITSERIGLPAPWHPDTTQILSAAPAPAPDMTSQAVFAAQPKSRPEDLAKVGRRRARRELKHLHNTIAFRSAPENGNTAWSTDFPLKANRTVQDDTRP